ncbi:hypothetical protein GCM10027174_21520 [Salinifilum aidingensis]
MPDSDSTPRHNRPGGVRVTDLLRRSGRYERLARAVLSGEHGGSAHSPGPARTTIAIVGVTLLCTATTAMALILRLGTSATSPAQAEPAQAAPVTGAPALLPDVLHPEGASCTGPGRGTAERPLPASPGDPGQVADPAAGSAASAVRTVRSFYRALAADPAAALPWLHPRLRAGAQHELVPAWSGAEAVRLTGARAHRDGRVVASAVVRCADGSRVTLRQSFAVSNEPGTPRITDARLLSASRTQQR